MLGVSHPASVEVSDSIVFFCVSASLFGVGAGMSWDRRIEQCLIRQRHRSRWSCCSCSFADNFWRNRCCFRCKKAWNSFTMQKTAVSKPGYFGGGAF